MPVDPALATEDYCYLTTEGRVSGRPHEIEIWFGLQGETLYLLSGSGDTSDWVRNLQREPRVTVRLGGQTFEGAARVVEADEEAALARRLLFAKYSASSSDDLTGWRDEALPVAVDLQG